MQPKCGLSTTRSRAFVLALACMRAMPSVAQGMITTPSILAVPAFIYARASNLYPFAIHLVITGAIFVVVAGLLAFIIIKFHARKGDADHEPAQVYGSKFYAGGARHGP